MPTYEYECKKCGWKFEKVQPITAAPFAKCPKCHGHVHRIISGGAGFIMKGSGHDQAGKNDADCSLKQTGKTCCGLDERCGKSPCGDQS